MPEFLTGCSAADSGTAPVTKHQHMEKAKGEVETGHSGSAGKSSQACGGILSCAGPVIALDIPCSFLPAQDVL